MKAVTIAAVLFTLSFPAVAGAQSYVERPLTTHSGQLDLYIGPVPKPLIEDMGLRFRTRRDDLHLDVGLGFGITDDIELGLVPLRLRLFDGSDLDNPLVWATFRIVSGTTEIGIRPMIPLPIFDSEFWVRLDIPVVFHLSPHARLETGGQLEIQFEDPTEVDLTVPLRIALNVTPQFFFGLDTGVNIPLTRSEPLHMPFGVFLGYTVAPGVDFALALRWPTLIVFERGRTLTDGRGPELILGVNVYDLL